MKKTERKIAISICLLASFTGALILIIKNFFQIEGAFGIEPHFILDEVKWAHYLMAPPLIFVFGLLWSDHIKVGLLAKKKRRRSGLLMIILTPLLFISGQSLLALSSDLAREVFEWVHIITGASFFILFFIHSRKKTK